MKKHIHSRLQILTLCLLLLINTVLSAACNASGTGDEETKGPQKVEVKVYIDGKEHTTLYTDSTQKYLITPPQKPTSPKDEKYFFGWFIDATYQSPLLSTTLFKEPGAIYGKWVSGFCDGFKFSVENNVATILSYNDLTITKLNIPATLNGVPVCTIGGGAFYSYKKLTELSIAYGIKQIGKKAFGGCTSLERITIPRSVEKVEAGAFSGCYNVRYADIPTIAIKEIQTEKLEKLILNSGTSIDSHAFKDSVCLKELVIAPSVKTIECLSYSKCTALEKIYIDDMAAWCSVSGMGKFEFFRMGSHLFWSDTEFESENPLSYAHNLYLNEKLVTDLTIPDGVTEINDFVFCDCTSITSVSFPKGLTTIGAASFAGCTNLSTLKIPNSVKSIGNVALVLIDLRSMTSLAFAFD